MKKIITLLTLVFLFTACSSDDDKTPQIIVDKEEVNLIVGETYQLKVEFIGKEGNPSVLAIFTDDLDIASIDSDYLITAKSPGETTATIRYDQLEKKIKILVED